MPLYQYHCSSCDQYFEELRKIDQRNARNNEPCPLCNNQDNSLINLVMANAPKIVSGIGSTIHSKTDEGFRDTLRRIKKHHPRNTIRD